VTPGSEKEDFPLSNVETRIEAARVLTDLAVAEFRKRAWRRLIRDKKTESLYLCVYPTGRKCWMMRFRVAGRTGKIVLGPVGDKSTAAPEIGKPLSLADARTLAAEQLRQRGLGNDPIADHREKKRKAAAAIVEGEENNFAAAARDFVEKFSKKKVRRWREQARLLGLVPTADGRLEKMKNGLAERWANKPLAEIGGHHIYTVVEETRERGAPGLARAGDGPSDGMARNMLNALSRMFRWCVEKRKIEKNPCAGVHRPAPPKARERVLTNGEIVSLWRATETVGEPFGSGLRLLLLTGCRLREIGELAWSEIGADGMSISLSGNRTKNHKPHTIPLSSLAREILARVPRIENCNFVFSVSGRSPVSGWSTAKARLDRLMPGSPPWRIHDLRRTFVTGLAELGERPDIIELCVNHISGHKAGIAGIYNRSVQIEARRAAMERWSAHIQGLVSGETTNVVAIAKKRRT
jgi:integrase